MAKHPSGAVARTAPLSTVRPRGLAALVPALIGLASSVYLTVEHFTASTTLACPENGAINCTKVTTSSYSHIGPFPVALLGLLYFVAMTVLVTPPLWRHKPLDNVRIVGAGLGLISVFYLVWAELFRIDAICLWCTAVHVSVVALLAGILWNVTAVLD